MAAYINRIYTLIVLILICDIQCDINNDNNGNKLTQSSEKDSKVSQHENGGENKVNLDESGINVKPKPSHDNLNIKHVSSHNIKKPLESSLSDQGDREASSKSQPIDTSNQAPNIDSHSSVVFPDGISSDKVENDVDPLAVDNGEILFEETGGPEDSLVDQMKRLSEKIKESEKKESVEMKMPDKLSEKEIKMETENIEKLADKVNDIVRLDDNSGTKLKTEDTGDEVKIKEFDRENNKDNLNIQNGDLNLKVHKVEQNVEQGNRETIMEQMKKLEKEALERETDIPSLNPSYGNEDLPSEEELEEADKGDKIYNQDNLGKSDDQFGQPSSEVVIDNTQPPPSDILPTKTEGHLNEHIKQTTEQLQLRPTPSLENVKSTVHTLSQVDATEQIQPTARADMKSSKRILNAQERKNLRLAKNKKQTDTDEKQIPAPVKTNVNPTPIHEVNVGTKETEIVNKEVRAAVDVNAATEPENIKTVAEELETSENDITGTAYDTNVLKEAVVQETLTEKKTENRENLSPTKVTGK